jgi:oxygen-dependent protoporphyrinogen oxidase
MSAAATFPPLLAAAQKRGSLMRALRAEIPPPPADPPPLFWTIDGGMSSLIGQLCDALTARGVEIRRDTAAERLERLGARWSLSTGTERVDADAVVLALHAPGAAHLLRPHDDEAAALLDNIPYASVTLVTFRVPADAVTSPLFGTGFLVPRRSPAARGHEGWAVTACTYLSQKWPHLSTEGEVLLRASVGRYSDERAEAWSDAEVTARAWEELGMLMGLAGEPLESIVTRWPHALPQYRVHHLMRTAGIEAAMARLGGIAVAGSAYRGVGIPACIASGRAAAQAIA